MNNRKRKIGEGDWRDGKENYSRNNTGNNQTQRFGHFNGNRNRSHEHYNPFGVKRLTEFLLQTNDEVIMALDKSKNNFRQNLLQECNNDVMVLLIQIVGEKVCGESSIHEIQNNLVVLCTEQFFLDKILKFTSEIPSLNNGAGVLNRETNVDRSPTRILNALSAFYGRICARMPVFAGDKLLPYIQVARNVSELLSLKGVLPNESAAEIESRFKNMIEDIITAKEKLKENSTEDFQKKIRKRQVITTEDREKLYRMTPVEDFRTIKIIPSKDEILSDEEPFLRPNLINGKYPSALTYLDVQYRLLREDFLAPLRESVKKYFLMNANDHDAKEKRPAPGTIRIYRDVRLNKVHCTIDVTLFTMKFSTANLKRVKWENSKRLLTGSLLLLTPDRFRSIYFATVGRRDERKLRDGLIDIIWEGNRPDTYDSVNFLMIECEVYFESYRHTLKALQSMAEPSPPHYDKVRLETYGMSKYIVDVTKDPIPPPKYLRNVLDWDRINFGVVLQSNQRLIEMHREQIAKGDTKGKVELPKLQEFKINPLKLEDWPSAADLGMDNPQYVAFQSAMTQELAIIQGPPGTGKTYIGLQIMKMILANALGPVLVVCYTNHALDQFLDGILLIMDSLNINPYGKLVRVGGQSKNEGVQQYNVSHIRNEYLKRKQFEENYASLRFRTRRELALQQDYRSDLKSLFSDLCNPNGIVNFAMLEDQLKSKEMTVDLSLDSIIKGELQSIFLRRNGTAVFDFLRLSNTEFEVQHFSADSVVKRFFRIRAPINRKPVVVNKEEEMPEEEMEDEELRSILVAHRLEEEILEEDRKYKAVRLQYHLHPQMDEKFKSSENELFVKLEDAERKGDFKLVRSLQYDLYELGLQRNKFKNQCEFVGKFMQSYKDGQVDLPKITPEFLDQCNDKRFLWRLSISEKWAIYLHIIEVVKRHLLNEIIKIEAVIIDAQKKVEEVKNQGDGIILREAQVVGMTTTGAAKYNTVLRMIKSKIVIVEEAAEVLEAHIVTSITEHCEHLILIGDHQQLKPSTTVYKLAKDYQLDVSLFERLIKNDISWKYLRAQHRMRPEICKLLVPTIYPDLENHSNVYEYPPVKGPVKNVFFVNHSNPEKADNDSMTKSNEYEAQYITQLCRYLMLQGYKPSQITILTTYIGQMFLIKRLKMADGDTCRDVRVTVVDNFQGEENDIILLSLVRSNEENKIGFLRTDNRICVALSRAKQGLYIVGNMDCLVNSPCDTWKKISEELTEQDSIGSVMKIRCENHEEIIEINSPEDFRQKSPEGGCTKMCPGILPRCNHKCRNICHIVDRSHELYECKRDCERRCPDTEKHSCPFACYVYPCPPCEVTMKRNLPCGHVEDLSCHIDINDYLCKVVVQKELQCGHSVGLACCMPPEKHRCTIEVYKELDCGHTKLLPCYEPVTQYNCVEKVTKLLDCGHNGIMKCVDDPSKFICKQLTSRNLPCGHEQNAPCKDDIASINCQTMFEKLHPECNHKVQVPCCQLLTPKDWKCVENCEIRLNCGHQCVRQCHSQNDPEHVEYSCEKTCARSCENGHKCRKDHPCHENCEPCKTIMHKTVSCGHQVKALCSQNEENLRCNEICGKTLPCGHTCSKRCYMACEPCTEPTMKTSIDCGHTIQVACNKIAAKSICNELTASTKFSLCGHVVKVPCRISDSCSPEDCIEYCRNPCDYKFDYEGGCGHTCQGDCASCYQGRIHIKCKSKCERVLACGHVCKFPCSSLCPPCADVCLLVCNHSKCNKKCGEPCTDCKERCKMGCEHSQCRKRCSEMCNRSPCNEACKKKIEKCGHDCIGSCGEPCPPYCRICDKEIVEEFLFGEEGEENARFVYLEDCEHIIHRESMDTWMIPKEEDSERQHQIGVKRCPKCHKIITKCARYGNIIKKQVKDMLDIRTKIFGNSRTQRQTQQVIAQKIQRQTRVDSQFENVREFLERKLYQMTQRGRKMDLVLRDVDQYTFESLHNITLWWEEAEKNVQSKEPTKPSNSSRQDNESIHLLPHSRNELVKLYSKLFEILLSRTLPLSKHEIGDFDQEFVKLYDLYSLGLRRGIEQFDTFGGALDVYNSTHQHLMQKKPYDEDMQKKTQDCLTKLEGIIKVGWETVKARRDSDIRRNRESIFQAMGFAGNHWYRCINGHLYVVADCGALNQSGRCPECRTVVGRGSRNIAAVRDEQAIQQQINNVVDIFPEQRNTAPVFRDRNGNANRNRGRGGWKREIIATIFGI